MTLENMVFLGITILGIILWVYLSYRNQKEMKEIGKI